MRERNIDIRAKAKEAKIRFWEIGEKLGMSESTFTRYLRRELDTNSKERILTIVQEMEQQELEQAEMKIGG
jgi:AraC-like DNA-binding protein